MNNANHLSGSMDHVAIYSQFLGDNYVAGLVMTMTPVFLPTAMPSSNLGSTSFLIAGQSKSGCDAYCMFGIIVGLVGTMLTRCGILAKVRKWWPKIGAK